MKDRFVYDGLYPSHYSSHITDKETGKTYLIKGIVDVLNDQQATIDKQNKIIKEQTLRVYCQDQEIQKLINQLEKIPDSIKDVWLKD